MGILALKMDNKTVRDNVIRSLIKSINGKSGARVRILGLMVIMLQGYKVFVEELLSKMT